MSNSIPLRLLRFIGTRNWIRWGLRLKFFRLIKPRDYAFTVPFFGLLYKGNLNSYVDRRVFFWGAHEREVMMFMGSLIKPGSVVFDIGANVGNHSLYFASLGAAVHSFEPNPEVARSIEEKIQLNATKNIFLHHIGLSDKNEELNFYAPTGDNKGIGSFEENFVDTNKDIGKIHVETGDTFVLKNNVSRVDFIKIDAEGSEYKILAGLKDTLMKFKPRIVIEYLTRDADDISHFLKENPNYLAFSIEGNTNRFVFFNEPTCHILPFDPKVKRTEVLLVSR